ncbi:hypothetical protein E2562_004909 [Oryza meyeriana var. granulata]|uniref:MATH domain-containing protein n=1 Tax=Oryza meyeriana var. granulata TaxID=110450 RepID=A0A6G1C3U8_9ORYZ|nr:hypothetical protein E2562_004909 [Oryza meyeriana var. granulata]
MSNSSATSSNDDAGVAGDVPEPSRSSIVVKAVSRSHVLKVEGYAGSKGLGVGVCIKSGSFDVGGHDWCIRYYPDGDRHLSFGEDDWIGIFLYLCGTVVGEVKAKFTISLLDQDDEQPVPAHSLCCARVNTFSTTSEKTRTRGFPLFMERKTLEESPYLRDDSFLLRCDVTVVKEIRVEPPPRRRVAVPLPDMHRHLGRLLSSGDGADFLSLHVQLAAAAAAV